MSPSSSSRRRRRARRRSATGWLLAFALIALAAGAGVLAAGMPQIMAAGRTPPTPALVTSPSAAPSATPGATATASSRPKPVYRLAGRVPTEGANEFTIGTTRGEVAGRSGTLHRYRIAVEVGSNEDVEEFGDLVEKALSDPRSWTAGGEVRLQRVAAGEDYDFTVFLATRATAHDMCARGGTNNKVNGVSYTSCRAVGQVILNLDRWRLSVDHLVDAKVTLSAYRAYVVNHEVGHELGWRHEGCPGPGGPAPVMMQQTLFLNGCKANPWPYVDGKLHRGPVL
jgi:hypothetical protein